MIFGNGKESFRREGRLSTYIRNGSFVDVWFERDGRRQMLRMPVKDLESVLSKSDFNDTVNGSVEFDTLISNV